MFDHSLWMGIGAQNIDIKRMGSWYIDINRVSNIYKYRYEHLRLMSGQGHPRSRGQERSNLYFRPLCDSMHVYGSDFRKEREKWPKTSFFRTQVEQNLKIGNNGNSQKCLEKWLFSWFKMTFCSDFSRYIFEIWHAYLPTIILSHIFRFFRKDYFFLEKKYKRKFFVVYFYNFQNFEKFKISR